MTTANAVFMQLDPARFSGRPILSRMDFVDLDRTGDVISSKQVCDCRWKALTANTFIPGVNKRLVPIKHEGHRLTVMTTVAPDTTLARHAHDKSSVIRCIVSGSMRCNEVVYGPGDWMITPAGTEYEIYTETGYTALVEYSSRDARG